MGNIEPTAVGRRAGAVGVHGINRFVLTVPSLDEAQAFYSHFGLDVRRNGNALELRTFGNPHCWGAVHADGAPKQLQYLSFGIFAEDLPRFEERVARLAIGRDPHPLSDGRGLWLSDVDGLPLQLVVAARLTPEVKPPPLPPVPVLAGRGAAPARSAVAQVRPRRLSHVLRFTPDVPRMVRFCSDVLGLRLSDHSADIIAFLHGVHGSDHHIVAFAKSHAPGLHHSSWDVGSFDEVGLRRRADAHAWLRRRLGCGPARAGLELLLLCARSVEELGRILVRHRLRAQGRRLAGRRSSGGGFHLRLGSAAAPRVHRQSRSAGAVSAGAQIDDSRSERDAMQ